MKALTPAEITTALFCLDPNVPRDEWAKAAMSLKSELGEDAFAIFDDWSRGGESYNATDCRATWRSVKATGRITINWIISRAKKAGWKPQQQAISEAEKGKRREATLAREKARKAREREEEKNTAVWHKQTAAAAAALLKRFCKPTGESDYLQNKKVDPPGVAFISAPVIVLTAFDAQRVTFITGADEIADFWKHTPSRDNHSFMHLRKGTVVVPMFNTFGDLNPCNVQCILPPNKEGKSAKLFLKFAPVTGCSFFMHAVGKKASPEDGTFFIAEGLATAASVHQATGCPVVVAFNANNLLPVAKKLRVWRPRARIVIAADDDSQTKGNPGLTKAKAAADAVGGVYRAPKFAGAANG